ncbi:MAG: hypothetical protein JXR91_04560 [Deltaproteobacteria bacterium]|nr:hypothetical protein [Deltaproteobacteria bacterium]
MNSEKNTCKSTDVQAGTDSSSTLSSTLPGDSENEIDTNTNTDLNNDTANDTDTNTDLTGTDNEDCSDGIANIANTVCCALSCGTCGGAGCAQLPGGAENCCAGTIIDNGILCDNSNAPCISDPSAITPDDTESTDSATEGSCVFEDVSTLYTQTGTDPTFQSLLDDEVFPVGVNSTIGVLGSDINVNNALLEICSERTNGIPQDIKIHTLCNSTIPRTDFDKWTRWYQEDGNTQIFRLFEGEYNVRNDRPEAARVESFTNIGWKEGDGWYQWEGTYTIIKPHECSIFQAKNSDNDWGIMINMTDEGDIVLNHRLHKDDFTIATTMTGIPFELKVRDNGREYEVYLNGEFIDDGYYDRPDGTTNFRWGMYDHTIQHDAMIFVTSAKITEP